MAQHKRGDGKITPDASALAHNPFGALASLKASLPDAAPAAQHDATQSSTSTSTSRPGAFLAKVVVRHERKGHGGKTVTVIDGVVPRQRDEIASSMKKALGCGARVEGDSIVLQGDLVDRAITWLTVQGAKKVVRGS